MPTRFAQVRPEIRLAYEAHGERSAPVVLPDSWDHGQSHRLARGLLSFVAAGLRVVRFESRDMGWSTQSAGEYTVDDVATDVLGLMDALRQISVDGSDRPADG